MKNIYFFCLFCGASLLITGCSKTKEMMGLTKQLPDEGEVSTNIPLELPPEFLLTPPKKGAPTRQQKRMQENLESMLLKAPIEKPVQTTEGEKEFMAHVQNHPREENIKEQLIIENTPEDTDPSFMQRLAFWKDPELQSPTAVGINAEEERERLNNMPIIESA